MYGLTAEPLQMLYKIVEIFILLGVQLMATARARVRYVTVHRMAPNGPIKTSSYSHTSGVRGVGTTCFSYRNLHMRVMYVKSHTRLTLRNISNLNSVSIHTFVHLPPERKRLALVDYLK